VFLILLVIITFRDGYKLLVHKERFDFIPLITLLILIAIIWFTEANKDDPFWKDVEFKGELANSDLNGELTLYKDGTFMVKAIEIESRCIIKGDYNIIGDTLKLVKPTINSLSEEKFTSEYTISNDKWKILKPTSKNFADIEAK
jgi:hypothetical protein